MITFARKIFDRYPLAAVLVIAAVPRLIAAIFSKGFIHLDDHYDTVMVAYQWANDGMWGADGLLTWKGQDASTIYRFPLYNLFLYGLIRAHQAVGILSLDSMMYTIRAVHAVIALIPVWAAYHICRIATNRKDWAIAGGLTIALHGALPFLGVRNLIEVVGGSLWLLALMYLYHYRERPETKWLYVAGVVAGLAWMIRFQISFAVLPIPFLLWWSEKRILPVVHFVLGVGLMLVASGILDWFYLGEFARSTLFLLREGAGSGPLYNTIPLLFPVLLLVLLIPPLSGLLFYTIGRYSFWRNHLILFFSSLSFIIIHSLLANQQERFVLPILPAVLVLAVLSFYDWGAGDFRSMWQRPLFRRLAIPTVILNLLLLLLLTLAYGRKGMVEPFVEIRDRDPSATILVIQPGLRYYMPISYMGHEVDRLYVREWEDMAELRLCQDTGMRFDYVILFPPLVDQLDEYRDSATAVVGPLEPAFQVEASLFDWIAHSLNPRHNHSFAAWVYRTIER